MTAPAGRPGPGAPGSEHPAASIERRIAARLIDAGIVAAVVVAATAVDAGGSSAAAVALLGVGAVAWWGTIALGSATPGGRLMGLGHVGAEDGQPDPARALGKYALEALVSVLTLGIGSLLVLITMKKPQNRHLFDRWMGLVVIDRRLAAAMSAVAVEPATPGRSLIVPVGTSGSVPPMPAPPPRSSEGSPSLPLEATRAQKGLITSVPSARPGPAVESLQHAGHPDSAQAARNPGQPVVELGSHEQQDHTTMDPGMGSGCRITLDTGVIIAIDSDLLIGRDPMPVTGFPGARLFALDDPGLSISKTHLAVSALEGSAVIRDLGSTNGTRFQSPGEDWRTAASGEPHTLTVGTNVRFGRRSFEVTG